MLEPFWVYFLCIWKWTVFLDSIATASFAALSSSQGPWNIPGVQPADTQSCLTAKFSLCGASLNLPTWLLRHFFLIFLWYFPTHLPVHLQFYADSVSSTHHTWQDLCQFSLPQPSLDLLSLLGTCHFSEPFRTVFSSLFLFFFFCRK